MTILKIQAEMLSICYSEEMLYKENQQKLSDLFRKLEYEEIRTEEDVKVLISLHRELSKIKNHKAAYLEEEIARLIIVDLPFSIRENDKKIPKKIVETLQESYESEQREAIKMSSELLKYAKEIVNSKDDKSKRYKKRVKEAIRVLNELQQFYDIEGIKEIFQSKIEDKDENLQFFALYGLEEYYGQKNADKITKEEAQQIEKIMKSSKDRNITFTCDQILINANIK